MENPQIPLNFKYPLVRAHALVEKSRISQAIEEVVGKRLTVIEDKLDDGSYTGSGVDAKLKKERDEAVRKAEDAKAALDKLIADSQKNNTGSKRDHKELEKKKNELEEALENLEECKQFRVDLYKMAKLAEAQLKNEPENMDYSEINEIVQRMSDGVKKEVAKTIVDGVREMQSLKLRLRDARANAGGADGADQANLIKELEAKIELLQVKIAQTANTGGTDGADQAKRIKELEGKLNLMEARVDAATKVEKAAKAAAKAAAKNKATNNAKKKAAAAQKRADADAATAAQRKAAAAAAIHAKTFHDYMDAQKAPAALNNLLDQFDLGIGNPPAKKKALANALNKAVPSLSLPNLNDNNLLVTYHPRQIRNTSAFTEYIRLKSKFNVDGIDAAELFLSILDQKGLQYDNRADGSPGEVLIEPGLAKEYSSGFDLSSMFIWM